MHRPGRKLRITGKGRCNLTNSASLPEFLSHFHAGDKFLRQAFARYFTNDLIDFMNSLDIKTDIERGGRVFPIDNDAKKIVDAMVQWVEECGVVIRPNVTVESRQVK